MKDPAVTRSRLLSMPETVHLVSWNNWPHLVQALKDEKHWPYDGIVFDEAEFLADSEGLWHKAAFHTAQRLGRVSRVIELSGLPTPNGREQLHGQIRVLDGGQRLGLTKTEFRERWMVPNKVGWRDGQVYSWKVRPGAEQQFEQAVADIMFSMKADLGLPEWHINDVMVHLDSPAEAIYRALAAQSVVGLGVGSPEVQIVAHSAPVLLDKLRQLCTGAVYDEDGVAHQVGDAKVERVAELVESLRQQGRPVVIAYQWDHEWPRLEKRFRKFGLLNIADKGVLAQAKAGKLQVVAGQCQAFSHGVDGLQHVYRDVIWTAPTYNYGVWEQLRKRFHRDGVKGEVMVHRLIAANTIEEQIAWEILPQKKQDADAFLDAIDLVKRLRRTA